jgi:hypothetical protein
MHTRHATELSDCSSTLMTSNCICGWAVNVGEVGDVPVIIRFTRIRHVEKAAAMEVGRVGCSICDFHSMEGGREVPLDMQACLLEGND